MQTATKRISIAVSVLLISAGLVLGIGAVIRNNDREVKTYRVDTGWGYSIVVKGKEVIKQPFIPVVEGQKHFATRHDAAKTGRMVLKKLKQGQRPTLTKEELEKAGIITQAR